MLEQSHLALWIGNLDALGPEFAPYGVVDVGTQFGAAIQVFDPYAEREFDAVNAIASNCTPRARRADLSTATAAAVRASSREGG